MIHCFWCHEIFEYTNDLATHCYKEHLSKLGRMLATAGGFSKNSKDKEGKDKDLR
jgi:uncharacterized C2H2 Zn-finger protein